MLNKGTTTRSRQDIEDELSALKSSVNVGSSNGRISASVNTTQENLMASLDIMTDMLKNPVFDAAELEKLKTQDLANLEQSKTDPQALAVREMGLINQFYPKGHPLYNMTIDEEIEAIKAVTVEDLKAYHKEFYGISDNASVVSIGNIDEQELKNYFETNFSDFKNDHPYTPISDKYHENIAANEKIITPDKKNAISFGMLAMEVSQDNEDYAALQVAGEILGGGFLSSRIANRLRQQDGVSYGAGGAVNVDRNSKDKNSSAFVYAIYAPENEAKVQKGFKEEIDRFIKDGITQEELETTVNGWVEAQTVSRAKDNELAGMIGSNIYYDRDMTFQEDIEKQVKSLTVADVNAAIKKYFKPFEEWTVTNGGDFENLEIKKEDKKVD
jgi:zinc protease